MDKYFHNVRGRSWTFAVEHLEKGRVTYHSVKRLSDTKVTRYAKLKCDANPYDTEWRAYFDKRETRQMLLSANGRNAIVRIWEKQNRRCPICGERIRKTTPWSVMEKSIDGKVVKCLVHEDCRKWKMKSNNQEDK